MSDFTIKVFQGPGDPVLPSQVKVIGNQLKVLANELPNLIKDGATIQTTSSVGDYTGDWTPAAKAAVETLLGSLSYRLWDGDNGRDVGFDDPAEDVHNHVKLVFVFEEEGQMVVPVPTAKNIERGETLAPLRLPAEYDMLVSEGTASEMGSRLAGAIANSGTLASITQAQRDEIVTELGKIADQMREEIKGDTAVFKAQLGDYSVRQCAG